MTSPTEKRRQQVLRAIVADYIASQQPVGSKALRERHQMDVSAATIRNDMAVLEREGYISQEHASSGRIPTQKAYRSFVNSIHTLKPLSAAERSAIISFLEKGVDLEDVLRRSVQLLSQLTRQAAVISLPTLDSSRIKHLEVVSLSPLRLLLVLITDAGRVDQRNVELQQMVSAEQVARLRDELNRALDGKTLSEGASTLSDLVVHAPADIRAPLLSAATVLIETLVERPSERMILAGAVNLLPSGLPMVLEALEEQVVMLKLLTQVRDVHNVQVLIGDESAVDELHGTSVVTAAYGSKETGMGGMGVVGPTYMDYTGTMSKVSAVARYVSQIISS